MENVIKGHTLINHCMGGAVLYTHTRKCAQCGQSFEMTKEHAYKRVKRDHYAVFCSWSCMRAWDRDREAAKLAAQKQRWEKRCLSAAQMRGK